MNHTTEEKPDIWCKCREDNSIEGEVTESTFHVQMKHFLACPKSRCTESGNLIFYSIEDFIVFFLNLMYFLC